MSDNRDSAASMAERIAKLLGKRGQDRQLEQPVSDRVRAAAKRAWADSEGNEPQCAALLKLYLAGDREAWEYLLHYHRDNPKASEAAAPQ